MRRKCFNIASTLSLILFIAISILWIRSYWFYDIIRYSSESSDWWISVDSGRILAMADRASEYRSYAFSWESTSKAPPAPILPAPTTSTGSVTVSGSAVSVSSSYTVSYDHHIYFPGFAFTSRSQTPLRGVLVLISFWLLAILTSILPLARIVVLLRTRSRHRRRLLGLCSACGYDLRATLDRCPECGSSAPLPAKPLPANQDSINVVVNRNSPSRFPLHDS